FLFFFFSSRRRHTRLQGDWSSDVCSSDLFALVIGNGRYDNLPPVPSAEHDAKAMEALLRDQYGFQVTLLLNAKNAQILSTLYALSQNLAENDNLVVFYAGHGRRDLRNRRGWWLPADAAPDDSAKTNWLP